MVQRFFSESKSESYSDILSRNALGKDSFDWTFHVQDFAPHIQ